jgi:hypothetical protein
MAIPARVRSAAASWCFTTDRCCYTSGVPNPAGSVGIVTAGRESTFVEGRRDPLNRARYAGVLARHSVLVMIVNRVPVDWRRAIE